MSISILDIRLHRSSLLTMSEKDLIKNELLCFLQQKSFDDLVKIATDFYTYDEIKGVVASIHSLVEHRIPAYRGTDRDCKTVSELLKLVVNPDVKLPCFVAVDISRLPPVDVEHMDMSALLQELALLRS